MVLYLRPHHSMRNIIFLRKMLKKLQIIIHYWKEMTKLTVINIRISEEISFGLNDRL